jgi:hypothetical protein
MEDEMAGYTASLRDKKCTNFFVGSLKENFRFHKMLRIT